MTGWMAGALTQVYKHLAKLKYFISKDLSTKDYKATLLLITQGDIQRMEQEILPAKIKPDRPIQNFD